MPRAGMLLPHVRQALYFISFTEPCMSMLHVTMQSSPSRSRQSCGSLASTGTVTLPESVEMVMPGDNVTASFELITPVALEPGLRFAVRGGQPHSRRRRGDKGVVSTGL